MHFERRTQTGCGHDDPDHDRAEEFDVGSNDAARLKVERDAMVSTQIEARGITDSLVLQAMRDVPRELFVPASMVDCAYEDRPLPIGVGQTISQPYIVAAMIAAAGLRPGARVLEVGTGSGYGAAVLSRIAAEVYTIERLGSLATSARARLARMGYANVHVQEGDGSLGWPAHAPYDAILVAASGPRAPRTLRQQLAVGGRLVMPVGSALAQRLVRVTRTGADAYEYETLDSVTFVPLIGAEGWRDEARG
jgi:protein-L-isoaspartate(D-aspartate) O-methyltransferase